MDQLNPVKFNAVTKVGGQLLLHCFRDGAGQGQMKQELAVEGVKVQEVVVVNGVGDHPEPFFRPAAGQVGGLGLFIRKVIDRLLAVEGVKLLVGQGVELFGHPVALGFGGS